MRHGHRIRVEAADAEVEAARDILAAALRAPLNDDSANERISVAASRLRAAQAHQTAVRTGMRLPGVIGSGANPARGVVA